jgi:MtrB/PioB family decaheme-associated outer membrane protein
MAVLAACVPAHAAEDESVAEGSVSAGAAYASGDSADRAIFGQYNGMRRHNWYGLLDFDYYRRNDDTGMVTTFRGFNVLGETRELGFMWKQQGNWKITADYGELVHYDPYTVNSGMQGIGSTSPQVVHLSGGPGTGSDTVPNTKRSAFGLAASKWFGPSLQFDASVKSENKEGSRIYGRGMNCPSPTAPGCGFTTNISTGWASLYLSEPIDSNHTQFEARLSWAVDKLRLNGGYYGSFYSNSNGSLNPGVPGSLNNAVGTLVPLSAGLQPILNQAMALPPDNQAHHFDLGGIYLFTPTTRANFKLGYSWASQSQDFAGAGLGGAPGGVSNLDGEVSTTLAQVGISSRPMPKLSLIADLRYEDRHDKTPLARYNVEGGPPFSGPANTWTNRNYSNTKTRGKLQASYQFSRDYRGTLGADYYEIERGAFTSTSAVSGVSALRQKNDEMSYRAELRRRMSENFSGTISYVTSKREGSNWLRPNSGTGVTEVSDPSTGFTPDAVFMPSLADRKRDKVRLIANWQPMDDLSLQFSYDDGQDRFSTPTDYSVRSSKMNLFSVDFDYALTSRWRLNGYLSQGSQKLNQARPAGYVLGFDNTNTSIGLGLVGKPTSNLQVGGALSFINDRNAYDQGLDANASANSANLLAVTGGLPDIVFRMTELRAFGNYSLSKAATVRVDFIYQYAKYNDWGYGYNGVPYVYSDNTTVTQQQSQHVTFLGARYIYRWQ